MPSTNDDLPMSLNAQGGESRSQPPPPSGGSERLAGPVHEPIVRRYKAARASIEAVMGASALLFFTSSLEYARLGRMQKGGDITDADVDRMELLVAVSLGLMLFAYLFAIVTFLRWIHRAYVNLRNEAGTKHTDGWALASWFVPVLSLWRPVKIVQELLLHDRSDKRRQSMLILWTWWVLWIASLFFGRVASRVDLATTMDVRVLDLILIVHTSLTIVSGALLIKVMSDISNSQTLRQTGARLSSRGSSPI